MCEPITLTSGLAIAGTALAAAGTAATVYSAYESQKAQNKANEYNAAMLQRNAEVQNLEAQHLIDQGKVDENAHRQKVKGVIASQRAAAAGNGLLVDSGTTEQIVEDTAGFGELDALTIRNNAARAAWGAKNTSADYSAQSNLVTMKNSSPFMAAAPSLLSGGSQLAGGLYSYNKEFGRPASIKAKPY